MRIPRPLTARKAALAAVSTAALLPLMAHAAPYAMGSSTYGVSTAAGVYVGFTRGCDATYNNAYGLGSHIQINGTGGTPCAPAPYAGTDGSTPFIYVYDGTLDTTGLNTSSFDNTRLQINGTNGSVSQASAAADLATASLHGLANGGGNNPGGGGSRSANSDSYLHDTLHFSVAGADANARTPITVRLSLDGTTANYLGDSTMELLWAWAFGDAGVEVKASNYSTAQGWGAEYQMQSETTKGWFGFNRVVDMVSPDNTDIVYEATYELLGGSQDIDVASRLYLVVENASLNYMNTGKLSLITPSTVSFTSRSGTFLSAVTTDPGNSVPEPASIALMLAALGAAGAASRARRR